MLNGAGSGGCLLTMIKHKLSTSDSIWVEQSQYIFKLGSDVLKTVQNYKYLGVILDEHMDFELNASIFVEAAMRALGVIWSKLEHLKECGYKSFDTLFKAGVLTIADHPADVWGTKSFPKSEQVQYKAARYFLGVHRFAPIEAFLGDMGWMTVITRHEVLILKSWNKLCCLPSGKYLTVSVHLSAIQRYMVILCQACIVRHRMWG